MTDLDRVYVLKNTLPQGERNISLCHLEDNMTREEKKGETVRKKEERERNRRNGN
jgi:hypothetical protein